MADGIFTDEELKADQTGPEQVEQQGSEQQSSGEGQQGTEQQQQQDRPRRADGTFMSAEEIAAQQGEQQQSGEGDDGKQKTVPQQALHAEREKRKALEAELAPLKQQLAALAKMREQIAARQPKPFEEGSGDDPNGVEHLKKRIADLEQSTTRVTQHLDSQAVESAELQQIGTFMAQSEAEYRQQQPDYDKAIEHVVLARANELKLYGLTPPQIQATIAEEATEIVRSAISQNRNPAELGYQIALQRGYRPQQTQEAEQQQQQGKSAAQATLDAIAEARKQGKSLGSSGGGAVKQLNAEAVLAMSPEEFDRLYSTPEGKAMIDAL